MQISRRTSLPLVLLLIGIVVSDISARPIAFPRHLASQADDLAAPDGSGIKEQVPDQFKARYEKWRSEFLATEYGREQWDRFAADRSFLLTIRVSDDHKFGAETGEYRWNKAGKLVGATIFLGRESDKGIPEPIYYPVMNSLSAGREAAHISGSVLASAKLAHELGHVELTLKMDESTFERETRLMRAYYEIFLKNGYDTRDPRLVKISGELGATPIQIWEDREYWSEVSALRFLVERLDSTGQHCSIFSKMQVNIVNYAADYLDRFSFFSPQTAPRNCKASI